MITPLIKLSHVSKYYKTKTGVAEGMRDVSLELFNNEFVAITGESGSGKTTLLNVISGLDSYEDGELYYNGLETSHYTVKDFEKFRAQNIAFVFQNYNVIESYTVYDNVVIALEAQNYPKEKIKDQALDLIEKVGLLSHKNHRTAKLSGGQKQRVVIARALAKDAPIILADEPTGNLDSKSSDEILTLLKEISEDRLVVLVSHNLDEVNKFATRKIIMEDGGIKNDIKMEETTVTPSKIDDDFSKSNSIKKGFKIALRNIIKTPKRTIFTLLLTSLVLFATMFFYSSLIVNAIDSLTSNNYDDDPAIAIINRDESSFKYDDLETFKLSNKYNVYFDINFHNILYAEENELDTDRWVPPLEFNTVSSARSYKLIAGRMPENNYELLIRNSVYHYDALQLNQTLILKGKEFKIVGVLDYSKFSEPILYFRDEFIYNRNLEINEEAKPYILDHNNFSIIGVSAKDNTEIDIFKKRIDSSKYQIIDLSIIEQESMKLVIGILSIIFWGLLIIVLQVLFIVIFQIQKNMMKARTKDFSVYRSIGISEVEVSLVVLFEQIVISLISSIFVIGVLLILGSQIEFVHNITRNLRFGNYLLIILLFLVFSIRLGSSYNKRIFNTTVIESLKEDN